jgi:hypothetical protein
MTNQKQIERNEEVTNQKNVAVTDRQLFTDREACEFLRISAVTLWRLRKAGKITFRRVASKIVYLREDLESYLERNKRAAFGAE